MSTTELPLNSGRVGRASFGRWVGWLCVAALLILSWRLESLAEKNAAERGREPGLVRRLLGPIAMLAAGVEWVRADAALRAGEYPLAYARAETALELEPGSADAWIFFAHHLIFERASLSREVDPAERRVWVRAGLDVLDRGWRASLDPGEIDVYRGGVFVALASVSDADRPWSGSARAAWLEAARSFDRAASEGYAEAGEAAAAARAHAAALQGDRDPPFREVPEPR